MNEITGAFIGGIVFCGLVYFIYTKVKESRNKTRSTTGSPGGTKETRLK